MSALVDTAFSREVISMENVWRCARTAWSYICCRGLVRLRRICACPTVHRQVYASVDGGGSPMEKGEIERLRKQQKRHRECGVMEGKFAEYLGSI